MTGHWKLKLASLLFQHTYFLYKPLYFRYKNKKDGNNLKLIKTYLKPGSNILDIGSNIGFYAAFFSEITGNSGRVYCFEPDIINFSHLKNTLLGKSNAVLIQKAVAATSGKLKLYRSPLLNVDHRTYPTENSKVAYEVEKISIDDYVCGRFKVDFIKIDIQGFEMEALKGMKQTLTANDDVILFMELWNHGLNKSGSSATEVVTFLLEMKFQLYKIDAGLLLPFKEKDARGLNDEFYSDVHIIASRINLSGNG